MNKYILFFIYIFSIGAAKSQTVVWKNDDRILSISKNVFVLEDKKGDLSIEQVSDTNYSKKFRPFEKEVLSFGFTNSIYWLKFDLRNYSNDTLLLQLDQAFIPFVLLYYKDSGGSWIKYTSGYDIPLDRKFIVDQSQIFPLPLKNASYYLQIKPYVHAIPINVIEKNYLYVNTAREKMSFGIYAGILLFAVVINIFLFFSLKKIYYVSYSILVFFYLLTSALVMEGYAVYFFPTIDLMFWYKIVPVLDMPALLFYLISFFELKKKHRTVYKLASYCCLFFICYIIILNFLPLLTVLLLNQLLALFVFVLGISIGIIVGKSGNKLGYYFTTAYSIWFVLILVEVIYIQTGSPKHVSPLSFVSTAIFIEAFLLAFLQAKRFQWEKKEDHLRQFIMENKIDRMEENFKKEILNTQLEIQEQTFQNISQELHDNIGQALSFIKLNINTINIDKHNEAKEKLIESKTLLTQVIQDLRDLSKTLNTDFINEIGLANAIEQQLNILQKTGIYITQLFVTGEEKKYQIHRELVVFRIVQELLNNIVKHAEATSINITMDYQTEKLQIAVTDDGKGFETTAENTGLGLRNMLNRMTLINGFITIKSTLGKGTTATIDLPKTPDL